MSQQTTLHATDEEATSHVRRALESSAEPSSTRSGTGAAPSPAWQERKYPGRGTHEDPYIVDWDIGDAENPFNWSKTRKWCITAQVSLKSSILRKEAENTDAFIDLIVSDVDVHRVFLQ